MPLQVPGTRRAHRVVPGQGAGVDAHQHLGLRGSLQVARGLRGGVAGTVVLGQRRVRLGQVGRVGQRRREQLVELQIQEGCLALQVGRAILQRPAVVLVLCGCPGATPLVGGRLVRVPDVDVLF